MDHERFQQRLDEVLDNREQPAGDAQLRQMADADTACAEMLKAAESLIEGIDVLDRPTVRPDMADQVMAAVAVERSRSRYLKIWTPLCVAAAVLLAAIPLYQFWQGSADDPTPIAKPNETDRIDEDAPTPTEEPDLLVHRVGEALGEAIWATSYDQLTPAQKEWVKRATEEISPVADPMANTVAITVDAVVRTIEPSLPRP
ncbi:MAG: hypothetical protein MI757_07815 [Pirellulales bacterium]|nr:hypothetical protein [Pirellulales bacterium]